MVLGRFEINARLAQLALDQMIKPTIEESLAWEFWQIDVEEFFASNLLDLCHQLSNAWEALQQLADKESAFSILGKKPQKPSEIILARHKATHFQPGQFENHRIAQRFSILRRPYRVVDGKLEKELAKFTLPRVAKLIQDSVTEGHAYLMRFREATIG